MNLFYKMPPFISIKSPLNRSIFAEMPDTPFNVFFGIGASVPRLYPYISEQKMYSVTDYWMNPAGDIMIKFIELDHYIKFVEGAMYISNFMKPN